MGQSESGEHKATHSAGISYATTKTDFLEAACRELVAMRGPAIPDLCRTAS
jgi:hypothetical protein